MPFRRNFRDAHPRISVSAMSCARAPAFYYYLYVRRCARMCAIAENIRISSAGTGRVFRVPSAVSFKLRIFAA